MACPPVSNNTFSFLSETPSFAVRSPPAFCSRSLFSRSELAPEHLEKSTHGNAGSSEHAPPPLLFRSLPATAFQSHLHHVTHLSEQHPTSRCLLSSGSVWAAKRKYRRPCGLQTTETDFSQVWRLEIQDHGAFFWVADFSFYPPGAGRKLSPDSNKGTNPIHQGSPPLKGPTGRYLHTGH